LIEIEHQDTNGLIYTHTGHMTQAAGEAKAVLAESENEELAGSKNKAYRNQRDG